MHHTQCRANELTLIEKPIVIVDGRVVGYLLFRQSPQDHNHFVGEFVRTEGKDSQTLLNQLKGGESDCRNVEVPEFFRKTQE